MGQWDEGPGRSEVPGSEVPESGAGGGGGVHETFGKGGDRFAVSFEGLALVDRLLRIRGNDWAGWRGA